MKELMEHVNTNLYQAVKEAYGMKNEIFDLFQYYERGKEKYEHITVDDVEIMLKQRQDIRNVRAFALALSPLYDYYTDFWQDIYSLIKSHEDVYLECALYVHSLHNPKITSILKQTIVQTERSTITETLFAFFIVKLNRIISEWLFRNLVDWSVNDFSLSENLGICNYLKEVYSDYKVGIIPYLLKVLNTNKPSNRCVQNLTAFGLKESDVRLANYLTQEWFYGEEDIIDLLELFFAENNSWSTVKANVVASNVYLFHRVKNRIRYTSNYLWLLQNVAITKDNCKPFRVNLFTESDREKFVALTDLKNEVIYYSILSYELTELSSFKPIWFHDIQDCFKYFYEELFDYTEPFIALGILDRELCNPVYFGGEAEEELDNLIVLDMEEYNYDDYSNETQLLLQTVEDEPWFSILLEGCKGLDSQIPYDLVSECASALSGCPHESISNILEWLQFHNCDSCNPAVLCFILQIIKTEDNTRINFAKKHLEKICECDLSAMVFHLVTIPFADDLTEWHEAFEMKIPSKVVKFYDYLSFDEMIEYEGSSSLALELFKQTGNKDFLTIRGYDSSVISYEILIKNLSMWGAKLLSHSLSYNWVSKSSAMLFENQDEIEKAKTHNLIYGGFKSTVLYDAICPETTFRSIIDCLHMEINDIYNKYNRFFQLHDNNNYLLASFLLSSNSEILQYFTTLFQNSVDGDTLQNELHNLLEYCNLTKEQKQFVEENRLKVSTFIELLCSRNFNQKFYTNYNAVFSYLGGNHCIVKVNEKLVLVTLVLCNNEVKCILEFDDYKSLSNIGSLVPFPFVTKEEEFIVISEVPIVSQVIYHNKMYFFKNLILIK